MGESRPARVLIVANRTAATPALVKAVREPRSGHVLAPRPAAPHRGAVRRRGGAEVTIATLPERVSHWLKRDLPARVERLGVPVTVVRAKAARRPAEPAMRFGGS